MGRAMAERHSHDSVAPVARAEKTSAGGYLRSLVTKRSIVVGGHKTSVSLEDVFWNELRAIAAREGAHLSELVGRIDSERQHGNLSSAIRLFVFERRRAEACAVPTPSPSEDRHGDAPTENGFGRPAGHDTRRR